jgi:hypothetical protein
MNRLVSLAGACAFLTLGCSCGSNPDCSKYSIAINPASATADHAAAAPGNQAQFFVQYTNVPSGCSFSQVVPQADWSVSDTTDISISSAKDGTNGTATCMQATGSAAKVTASYQGKTATAQLTCN